MPDILILALFQAWADLDHAIVGLEPAQALTRAHGGSSIAWTVGHITQQVDSWFNVRFQGQPPHPVISRPDFHTGGSGMAADWPAVLDGVRTVQATARRYLAAEPGPDLGRVVPYDGGVRFLHATGLSLRYAVVSIAAHHWQHVGEIMTVRALLGHAIEDERAWGQDLR